MELASLLLSLLHLLFLLGLDNVTIVNVWCEKNPMGLS